MSFFPVIKIGGKIKFVLEGLDEVKHYTEIYSTIGLAEKSNNLKVNLFMKQESGQPVRILHRSIIKKGPKPLFVYELV
jgi:hypothetical protein